MGLSIDQMVRMSRLLDEALALNEAGRRRWLAALGPEDQDISEALREALRPGREGTEEALSTLPKVGADGEGSPDAESGLKPGARVGPYELIQLLGSGGMAEVWLARRADGAFKREVALKLPILTRLRKDLEERFARERDILASLEHVNIARLYDAGTDSNGLPYLSMEYVAGQPITDWCDGHKRGIRERLELVLQVLEGMQYAHERHVIHRDLKPSNILVTESGQVRLLDFGISKLLQTEEADRTQLTSVYGRALTPDYASPELIRGDGVDVRSDVYSIGVLLYELLTGGRPYRLKAGVSVGMLEQAIMTVEVSKPSTQIESQSCRARAVTREKLARLLRGDLDVIVLKALAKDPKERYASASAMAEDVRRHLKSEAIKAQPPKFSYRMRKYARRHRTGGAIAMLVAAAILATAAYEIHRIETDQERKIAELPAAKPLGDKSIAVLPFVDLSEKKDQEFFSDGLAEELIEKLGGTAGLKVIARTSSFSFKGKSDDIATIASKLKVANVLEGSVRRSGDQLRVSTQLIRADSGQPIWSETFEREFKDVFKIQDEIAMAVVSALKVQLTGGAAVSRGHGTTNPDAYNAFLLGRELTSQNTVAGWRQAIEAYQKAISLDPRYADAYAGLATSEYYLLDGTGDAALGKSAEQAVQRAIDIDPRLANGYSVRGFLRANLHFDWVGAQADDRRALALEPSDNRVLTRYADNLMSVGRLGEAVATYHKAIEQDPLDVAPWTNLATALTALGNTAAAYEAMRHALAIRSTPTTNWSLASLQLIDGKARDALATSQGIANDGFRNAVVAMAEHTLGDAKASQHALDQLIATDAADSAYQIAEVYAWRGEKDKAFEWLERAYRQQDGGLTNAKIEPPFASLRTDPRYAALLRKLNFPP